MEKENQSNTNKNFLIAHGSDKVFTQKLRLFTLPNLSHHSPARMLFLDLYRGLHNSFLLGLFMAIKIRRDKGCYLGYTPFFYEFHIQLL
jgi:hypothetical protein